LNAVVGSEAEQARRLGGHGAILECRYCTRRERQGSSGGRFPAARSRTPDEGRVAVEWSG